MHIPKGAIAALGAALVLLAPSAIRADTDHASRTHRAIRISSGGLHPEHQTIKADQALMWVNYDSRIARVSFDPSVAKNLKCAQRTTFTLDGSQLVSPEIQSQQFASLCQFAPGTYAYRLALYEGTGGALDPERTLEGTITVVE